VPLYEYECDACGQRFEVIQKFSDPTPDVCKLCGKGPMRRLLSSPAIQFKGSGFYITDYAQKGKSDSSTMATTEKQGSDTAKTDAGKSDTAKSDGGSSVTTDTGTGTKSDTAGSSTSSSSTSDAKKEKKE
jgi:putative FmdB family regulatory protein